MTTSRRPTKKARRNVNQSGQTQQLDEDFVRAPENSMSQQGPSPLNGLVPEPDGTSQAGSSRSGVRASTAALSQHASPPLNAVVPDGNGLSQTRSSATLVRSSTAALTEITPLALNAVRSEHDPISQAQSTGTLVRASTAAMSEHHSTALNHVLPRSELAAQFTNEAFQRETNLRRNQENFGYHPAARSGIPAVGSVGQQISVCYNFVYCVF
jgi:hypothetical protein